MKTLVLELIARTRTSLGWWLLGILSMAAYVVLVYDSIGALSELGDLYRSYPPAVRDLIGDVDITTLNGWIHVEFLSWLPLVLSVYAGIFVANTVSKESEQQTLDFVLGLPVTRSQFLMSRLAVGMLNMVFVCLIVFGALSLGVWLVGHTPSPDRYAMALVNAYLLSAAMMVAFLALAAFIDDQARLTGITLGSTLVLYVATGALKAAGAPKAVLWLMPFEHYHAANVMSGQALPVGPLILLVVVIVVATAAALSHYARRDL